MKNFKIISQEAQSATIGFDETDEGLTVTIDTERLRLTSVTEKEKKSFYTYLYGDQEVMEKFATGETRTQQAVQRRVTTWIDRWQSKNPFSSLAVNTHDDEFVGQVVLEEGDNPGESELGYLFAKKHWRQGFGTEAVTPVVKLYAHELAKKQYKINGQPLTTIVATARTDNIGSVKILEKTGMTLEKEEEKFGHMRKHYRKIVI